MSLSNSTIKIIAVILFLIIGISLTAKGSQVTGQEQQSYLIPGIIFLLISFAIIGFYMFHVKKKKLFNDTMGPLIGLYI